MDSRVLLTALFSLSLTACLEVKDDNQQFTDALTEQNQLLTQQNEILQQEAQTQTDSITLTGTVINLATEQTATNATVKYKIGHTWSEAQTLVNGTYEFKSLPAASDIHLLIESTDNSFMSREVFGRTNHADGASFQAVSDIAVSPSKTYEFSVYEQESLTPVTDLIFETEIDTNDYFDQLSYKLTSTYDEESMTYKVTAPAHFPFYNLKANLDVDEDGTQDYRSPYFYDKHISISPEKIAKNETIFVTRYVAPARVEPIPLEVRISVLDSNLNSLMKAAPVVIEDTTEIKATTLEGTGQHQLQINVGEQTEVLVPAFTENDLYYQGSNIRLRLVNESTINVRTSKNGSYYDYNLELTDDNLVDVIVRPREETVDNTSENLARLLDYSAKVDSNNQFKLFFSSSVEAMDNFYSVVKRNHVQVTRGNEESVDFILPGTTFINSFDKSLDVTTSTSLNGTLLSFGPALELESGSNYRYRIEAVKDNRNDSVVEVSRTLDVNVPFNTESGPVFNIQDIILDNQNFYTNGSLILPTNTAGQADTRSESSRSIYMYLPLSIQSLKNLTLQQTAKTEQGVVSNNITTHILVRDGQPRISKDYVVKVASNENLSRNGIYPETGTTLDDGWYYRYGNFGYSSDDKTGNVNNITFEYVYETLDGEFHTGTITLPVK